VRPRPLLALTIPELVRLWSRTWRYRFDNPEVVEQTLAEGPAVLAFWHGEQLAMIAAHGGRGFVGLASRSLDGELLAQVIGRLGYDVIRGSTSKGGASALRGCLKLLEEGRSPAIALDGPRGPHHVPHAGALALSAMSGRPILFGVTSARPKLQLGSWDRFEIPLPGAEVRFRYGVLEPPSRDGIEAARATLAERMEALRLSDPGSTRS
jgi:lysophospholipid acyltransferase (LPLAT)-like uncharacterized protein